MRKNIKNYTSGQSLSTTATRIQQILSRAGARKLMFEYTDTGELEALAFSINTSNGELPVKLPARIEKVAKVMYGLELAELKPTQEEQVKRTAWKNIQDWIDAQLALVETEMVKLEEVFLPYVAQAGGRTFFEVVEEKGLLLPEGEKKSD